MISFWTRQYFHLTFITLSLFTEGLPKKHDRGALRSVSGRLHRWRCQRSAHLLPALPLSPARSCQVRRVFVCLWFGLLWALCKVGTASLPGYTRQSCCPSQQRKIGRLPTYNHNIWYMNKFKFSLSYVGETTQLKDKRKGWESSVTGMLPLQLTHSHLQERSSEA